MTTKSTPGPWGWFGNEHNLYLATPDRGRQFIMGFQRWGMRGAQPTFQLNHRMVPAADLVRFEVDPSIVGMSAGREAESVYRYDIVEIAHPDARLISAAPDLLAALKELVWISDRKHAAWNRAREAIAKAEGKS